MSDSNLPEGFRLDPPLEPWPEPVDVAALLADLVLLLTRFVVLPKWSAEAVALWVIHTYAYELRDVSTYLGVESPEKRCGKTTLLSVLTELVSRPVPASNISSPAFFRVIQEMHPTLMIDETDTFLPSNEELRGILNSGYNRKMAFVVRVAYGPADGKTEPGTGQPQNGKPHYYPAGIPEQRHEILDHIARNKSTTGLAIFSCWCPKVIAQIGRLPDTLADRCVMIRMQRKLPDDKCERLRNLDATDLRRKCARFVLDHREQIASARPEIPEDLNDRAADIWEPLLAIADIAGGAWPSKARQSAIQLTSSAQDRSPMGALLLDIMLPFFHKNVERLFTRDLLVWLNGFEDRPWMEMKRGKEITERWLSQKLRPYGVRPRMMRIGEAQARGYLKDELADVLRRYLQQSDYDALKSEMFVTDETSEERSPSQSVKPDRKNP